MRAVLPLLLVLGACQELVIASVEPGVVVANGVVEVVGAGFSADLELHLEDVSGEAQPLFLIENSSTRARATVPGTVIFGTYDVVASNDDGAEVRLRDALTVTNGTLELFIVSAEDGDANFIIFPDGSTMLLDGGPRGASGRIKRLMEDSVHGRLDAVILSHADEDHLGGLFGILQGPDADPATTDDLLPGIRLVGHPDLCDTPLCDQFSTLLAAPLSPAEAGTVIAFGGASLTVVAANGVVSGQRVDGADTADELSLVALLEYAGRSILIGGDMTSAETGDADIEGAVAAAVGSVDVLHLSRHGEISATSFLETVRPKAALLSVGTDSASCGPSQLMLGATA